MYLSADSNDAFIQLLRYFSTTGAMLILFTASLFCELVNGYIRKTIEYADCPDKR